MTPANLAVMCRITGGNEKVVAAINDLQNLKIRQGDC
jgi:hypothetical protein